MEEHTTTSCLATNGPLSYEMVEQISEWLDRHVQEQTVIINVSNSHEATTAGLAHLLLLRKRLMLQRRDFCLSGLRGKAETLCRLTRLHEVLPQRQVEGAAMATTDATPGNQGDESREL